MTIEDEVKTLAEMVPRIQGTDLPGGADRSNLQDFTIDIDGAIPPELREWLSFTNGPLIGPGGIFGIHTKGHSRNISDVLQ